MLANILVATTRSLQLSGLRAGARGSAIRDTTSGLPLRDRRSWRKNQCSDYAQAPFDYTNRSKHHGKIGECSHQDSSSLRRPISVRREFPRLE